MQISGKTCVVTGAARGIGAVIAQRLAARGAIVYALDLELAEKTRPSSAEGDIRPVSCDVRNESQVVAVFRLIAEENDGLDILVNNAGIIKDGLLLKQKGATVQKLSLEDFRSVLDVNLVGTFLCMREAAAAMLDRGGVVVNISSVSRSGNFGQTNYSASKAGIDAMTVVWSKELARYNIRVAAIAPGYTKTEMVTCMRPEVLQKITAQVPLRRLGEMDEIAAAVEFVISNDFMTGKILEIDGGLRI